MWFLILDISNLVDPDGCEWMAPNPMGMGKIWWTWGKIHEAKTHELEWGQSSWTSVISVHLNIRWKIRWTFQKFMNVHNFCGCEHLAENHVNFPKVHEHAKSSWTCMQRSYELSKSSWTSVISGHQNFMDIWPKVLKVMNLVEDSQEVGVENVMNIVVHPKSQAKSCIVYLVSSSVKGCSSL